MIDLVYVAFVARDEQRNEAEAYRVPGTGYVCRVGRTQTIHGQLVRGAGAGARKRNENHTGPGRAGREPKRVAGMSWPAPVLPVRAGWS